MIFYYKKLIRYSCFLFDQSNQYDAMYGTYVALITKSVYKFVKQLKTILNDCAVIWIVFQSFIVVHWVHIDFNSGLENVLKWNSVICKLFRLGCRAVCYSNFIFFFCRFSHKNKQNEPEKQCSEQIPTGNFRRILAQILASTAKNTLLFNYGLAVTFPTILIPALTGLNTKLNPNETLRITPDESTWLGNI